MKKILITGLGCALVDYLYPDIDFGAKRLAPLFSKTSSDGGLRRGGLVFADDFERFSGRTLDEGISFIAQGAAPQAVNLGGPAVVAMVHCAQLLNGVDAGIRFYGRMGDDDGADILRNILQNTPLDWSNYECVSGRTPCTFVFSDPHADSGRGERLFVNSTGIAESFSVQDIPVHFFDAGIHLFGATALLPCIHDNLGGLLQKGKAHGGINVVTTVYDFRNAGKNPGKRWPMGESDGNYRMIDLLISDRDEALHMSGTNDVTAAMEFFRDKGVKACIVTQGHEPIHFYSDGSIFSPQEHTVLPVYDFTRGTQRQSGDTTGCGDNFAGGVLSSVAYQLRRSGDIPDLTTACLWGIASGAAACTWLGGTFSETYPGEKRKIVKEFFDGYLVQTARRCTPCHEEFLP